MLGGTLEELPRRYERIAEDVLPLLALATLGRTPSARRADVERLLDGIDRILNGDRAEAWSRALERHITWSWKYGMLKDCETERDLVGTLDAILDAVHEEVGTERLPPQLTFGRNPDGSFQTREYMASLRRAAKRLAGLRITLGKAGGRGRAFSPWGAAREVAACFGLHMPDKPSEKRRDYTKASRMSRNRAGKNAP
jgi:hypothetical protein